MIVIQFKKAHNFTKRHFLWGWGWVAPGGSIASYISLGGSIDCSGKGPGFESGIPPGGGHLTLREAISEPL